MRAPLSRVGAGSARRGLAMVAVLLVLMALFVLSAPFLTSVRNADQASAEAAERALVGVTLDAAARHAAATLAASHPGLDATPAFDDEAELAVEPRFPEGFLATDDPSQVMWDVDAGDVAARVDLASASPHVLANLIGGAARLTAACTDDAAALELSSSQGFLPEGVVVVDDEWIAYAELAPTRLARLARGLLARAATAEEEAGCGPSRARAHEVGAFVLDQRAWALCEWRLVGGSFRVYEAPADLRAAADLVLAPELGREAFLALARTTSPYGHVKAGARWQRPARLLAEPGGAPPYGCRLALDDLRWFNAGTTVRLWDGEHEELALVRRVEGGELVLTTPLTQPFRAHEALVAPLARAPVNVNTAAPEVLAALWTNLKLRGRSARITEGEAEKLVDLALVSRPFTGFEDFLHRFVLPAGGLAELPADAAVRPEALVELAREARLGPDGAKALVGIVDADDALALYKNSLNANDGELEFATMPLAFTSRDVYELEVRASVNAPSGVQRARGARTLAEVIVPQRDLLALWTRQEDFDDAPRLDRAPAGWLTGPVPTARHDPLFGEVSSLRWPSRARAHLGPFDTVPALDPLAEGTNVHSFAEREGEDGWAQLAAMREEDVARRASHALHYDDETKELEGRFLPDGTTPLALPRLGWIVAPAAASGASSGAGLLGPLAFSSWIRPRALEEGARLLDVAGAFTDADRLSLLFENGNLVLRVIDGAGDHPGSSFREFSEVHYPLTGGGPGLPLDTWTHVQIAVDGNRPDQLGLWVDGRRAERTPGLTRLSAGLSGASDTIAVESTDGFPDKCVLRIGDELIEAFKNGPKAFRARFVPTGVDAGFGGRLARELFGGSPELNLALAKPTSHPAGASVQLYGYSVPLFSNASSTASALADPLGAFAVTRVVGITLNGSERTGSAMEPIRYSGALSPFDLGHGFDGRGEELDGLVLASVDPARSSEDAMKAFSPSGGYAAVLGVLWLNGQRQRAFDIDGTRLGGVEVVRYRGYTGTTLHVTARGGAGLQRVTVNDDTKGRGSFIVSYGTGAVLDPTWTDHDGELRYQVMVIPISVPVPNTAGVAGFEQPPTGRSAFAQITRTGGEAHFTEWVRYDEITADALVRSDGNALLVASDAAHAGSDEANDPPPTQPPSQNRSAPTPARAPSPPASPPSGLPAPAQGAQGGSDWDYKLGASEDEDFPVARAVNSELQFRGVLGTFAHAHPAGALVLPTFRVRDLDVTAGQPGRFDEVMFLSSATNQPGSPGRVHHAHKPNEYLAYSWREDSDPLLPVAVAAPVNRPQAGFQLGVTHVALEERLTVPFPPAVLAGPQTPVDNRTLSRMVLFPSGELPREVQRGELGGAAVNPGNATRGGLVPAVSIDEALFFPALAPLFAGMPGQLVVTRDFGDGANSFTALKDVLRTVQGDLAMATNVLAPLPQHGGLLRIGDELLCYDGYDAGSFVFTLPPGGRGLFGTAPQPHRAGEGVTFLGALPVGVLGAPIGADDALLPLLELPPGFPSQGLVRIEDELVHYTRTDGSILAMPRASSEPGELDEKGAGLFRGRFGTARAAHAAGTPVVLHPFRYWDRWSELADAPELTYYELALEQPDAYWRRVFWKASAAAFPGPELGVLQRTNADTPWDDVPEDENGLTLLREGKLDVNGNPIGVQSDRVEWRVFVRHLPGSFDPIDGLAHGWKTTPRLELFGAEYMAPGRTLARSDR